MPIAHRVSQQRLKDKGGIFIKKNKKKKHIFNFLGNSTSSQSEASKINKNHQTGKGARSLKSQLVKISKLRRSKMGN